MGNTEDLEQKAAALGERLIASGWTFATAESCTGGGIAQTATAVAGSSAWFDRAFVTYSNDAKIAMLGVRADTLESVGAVSAEVAEQMAHGVIEQSPVDVSVAVTGIAGPDGGTADKPVGTVWFGRCRRGESPSSKRLQFDGDRAAVRHQTIAAALDYVAELIAT